MVTRTRTQAGALSEQLRALGADVIELPTIRIEPPTDLRAFAELVQDAHGYDWIVFTSPNGVDAFFDMFFKLYDDAREIGAARIAAIGPATAQRVKDFHLHVDLQPEEFVAEALVREFQKQGGVENLRILLARAEKARDVLPKQLSAWEQLWTKVSLIARFPKRATIPARAAVIGGRRRSDHFYQFIDGGKFSRARFALAERDAGREHRSDHVEDGTRSRFEGRDRSAPARYRRFGASDPQLFRERERTTCRQRPKSDEFAAVMKQLSAEAEKDAAGRTRKRRTTFRQRSADSRWRFIC